MTALLTREVAAPQATSSAVAWIDGRQATIATMGADGRVSTCEIERGSLDELDYLAQVVRAIGDRDRIVILGPSSVRLGLERDYVAFYRRPDRLVDVEPAGPVTVEELTARVRALSSG
ncbi:MAG TPA: hypothetical protein VH720_01505 [Candidatus Limnocylindrales bacterium]|jgi:hypothetical protein